MSSIPSACVSLINFTIVRSTSDTHILRSCKRLKRKLVKFLMAANSIDFYSTSSSAYFSKSEFKFVFSLFFLAVGAKI